MPSYMSTASRGELTARQARFVKEYMVDRNAKRAAMRAGYSPSSANIAGKCVLHNPKVQAALNVVKAMTYERVATSQARLMEEYTALALLDPAQCFNEDGTIKPVLEMPEVARRALMGIEMGGPEGAAVKKLKFAKLGALDSMAKIMGLMQDNQTQVAVGFAIHIHTGESDGAKYAQNSASASAPSDD